MTTNLNSNTINPSEESHRGSMEKQDDLENNTSVTETRTASDAASANKNNSLHTKPYSGPNLVHLNHKPAAQRHETQEFI